MKTANEITPTHLFHPGVALAEEIEYRQLTKKELAARMGISPTVLSEILSGKRNITPATAIKLESALQIDALYFLSMQMRYDYYSLKREMRDAKKAA
ncbi:MAG: HigA family addiction module antidote protein [Bacteroidetes bacterium]|nr:HigA family addiction module antidote protein [Bacteroidota bacterium]